jgi:hypothetical protein
LVAFWRCDRPAGIRPWAAAQAEEIETEMVLSERQQTAEALAREIARMGAWCVSPMPLDNNAKLRFQVMDADRDVVISKLASWDWLPVPCSSFPRITHGGWMAAQIYEIDLPRERQPVVDDRIHGEIAEQKKSEVELEALRKYLGITK